MLAVMKSLEIVVGVEVLTCTILWVDGEYEGPAVTRRRYFSGSSFFFAMLAAAALEGSAASRELRGEAEGLRVVGRAEASLAFREDIVGL